MSGLKISLLGGMEVGPSGGAGEISITRKAGAMIAYLALRDGHAQTRDKLAGLFWSRNTDEQARTNLRQALLRLRKALANGADGPLIVDGNRVGLNLANIDLDVARFESLIAEGTAEALEEAVALYRGDLLDGIGLDEEAFENWLRTERERLRTLAGDALAKLCDHYMRSRDIERCILAASRLAALDPLQETAHRTLMRAYSAQGRHALALKQYKACAETLARELGVEPDGETKAIYQEIQKQRGVGGDAAIMGRVIATAEALQGSGATVLDIPDRPSVAVLPFENRSGDSDQNYFAEGVTENVIVGLSRFRDLFVISSYSAFLARDLAGDPHEAGARLGVAHIVEGSVRRAGSRVRVTVQLSEAANGHRVWVEQYDRDLDDMFAVQDEISGKIVATLAGRIEDAGRRAAEHKTSANMTAYDYVLRARSRLNSETKEGVLEARRLLNAVLETDPGLAAAWSELARSFIEEYESDWSEDPGGAIDQAQALAEKAIALDGADAVSRYSLANAHFYRNRHELANLEIEKALELNPNDCLSLCTKGWFLAFAGRLEEGVTCSREAMRSTPFAPDSCMLTTGFAEYNRGRYEAAIEAFGRTVNRNRWRDAYLAASSAQLGRLEEARALVVDVMDAAALGSDLNDADDPECWRRYWARWFCYKDPADFEHLMEGLRKAGMPV
jgi:TolB-like protein